jgi:hypothetical protein
MKLDDTHQKTNRDRPSNKSPNTPTKQHKRSPLIKSAKNGYHCTSTLKHHPHNTAIAQDPPQLASMNLCIAANPIATEYPIL